MNLQAAISIEHEIMPQVIKPRPSFYFLHTIKIGPCEVLGNKAAKMHMHKAYFTVYTYLYTLHALRMHIARSPHSSCSNDLWNISQLAILIVCNSVLLTVLSTVIYWCLHQCVW